MKQDWEVKFEVDGLCEWRYKAANQKEAKEIAEQKFRESEWSSRYREMPPYQVRQIPREDTDTVHTDVAPPPDK